MGYVLGHIDRGELAGKFIVMIRVEDLEEARAIAKLYSEAKASIHEVHASMYDIDYNVHKLVILPAEKRE